MSEMGGTCLTVLWGEETGTHDPETLDETEPYKVSRSDFDNDPGNDVLPRSI